MNSDRLPRNDYHPIKYVFGLAVIIGVWLCLAANLAYGWKYGVMLAKHGNVTLTREPGFFWFEFTFQAMLLAAITWGGVVFLLAIRRRHSRLNAG